MIRDRERLLHEDLEQRHFVDEEQPDSMGEGMRPVGEYPYEDGSGHVDLSDLDPPEIEDPLEETRRAIDEIVEEARIGIPPDWPNPFTPLPPL